MKFKPQLSKFSKKLYKVMWILNITNFIVFVSIAVCLGGDALSGKIEDGQYYLAMGGKYTEVTSFTYYYSFTHALSTIILVIIMMVTFFFIGRSLRKKTKSRG